MTTRSRFGTTALALLLAGTVACTGRSCADAASPASSSGNDGTQALATTPVANMSDQEKQRGYDKDVVALREQIDRVKALTAHLPAAAVSIQSLAATLSTPDDMLAFVRDRVALEPYAGVLKGPAGTLISRGGNALDRSLLLAALLAHKGVRAEIANGLLSSSRAASLLKQIGEQPSAVQQIAQSMPSPPPAPQLTDEGSQWVKDVVARAQSRADRHRTEAKAGLESLASALGSKTTTAISSPSLLERMRDHYWVRAVIGGTTVDLDPAFASARSGDRFTEVTSASDPASIADARSHRLSIRIVADYVSGETLFTREIVRAEAKSTDLVDAHIRVVIEPRALSKDQNDFLASIALGTAPARVTPFAIRPGLSGAKANAMSGAFDALGGGAEPTTANGDVLARLIVEITQTGPTLRDATYRRVVLDRLDGSSRRILPEAESDDSIRTMLVQVWEGAVTFGAMHPLQMVRHTADALVAQQGMMEQALAARYLGKPFQSSAIAPPQFPRRLAEFLFHDSLGHDVILNSSAPGVRMFHERPQLAFVRHGVVVDDWAQQNRSRRFQEAIDLISLPYGLVGDGNHDTLRLELGVADASFERSLAPDGLDFNTLPLFGAAREQNIAFITVTPDQKNRIEGLQIPAPLKSVMLNELNVGRTVVAPSRLVRLNGVQSYGWWTVDAETGIPLGQMDLGAGQGAVESAKLTEATATLSHTIGKLYGGFVGCFFMEAASQLGPQDNLRPGFSIPGTASIQRQGQHPPGPGSSELAECLVHKWCEAVIEYAFLAAGVGSFHHRVMWQEVLWIGLHLFGPAAVSYLSCH